jgi:hypothetical protein
MGGKYSEPKRDVNGLGLDSNGSWSDGTNRTGGQIRQERPIKCAQRSAFPSRCPTMSFLLEVWSFLLERKKFWLFPIILAMVVLGGLVVLTKGSAVAPFIYTLF